MGLRFAVCAVLLSWSSTGCAQEGAAPPAAQAAATPPADQKPAAEEIPQIDPVAFSLREAPVYTHALRTLAFDPAGKLLATGNGKGHLDIWDVASGERLHHIEAHDDWNFTVAFSPGGKLLATGGGDNEIKLWNVGSGKLRKILGRHGDDLHGVAFLPDGKRLVSGGDDKTVRLWEIESGEPRVLKGHIRQVTAVAVSPDGKLIASSSRDHTVRLWDAETGDFLRWLEGHSKDVIDVLFSSDGSQIATASYDGTARLWNTKTGEELRQFEGHEGWVFTVALSLDDKWLATGAADKKLRILDATSGELRHEVNFDEDVATVRFHPDGTRVAVALTDGTVRLIDVSGDAPRETTQLGTSVPTAKANAAQQGAIGLTPSEYLALHEAILTPRGDAWKKAMISLADHGDGFTLEIISEVDKGAITSEDAVLLANTEKAIKERTTSEGAREILGALPARLERAAMADLGCNPFEGRLVAWTMENLKPHLGHPVVKKELEKVRDSYLNDELDVPGLEERVRHYAESLLEDETVEAIK